MMRRIICAHTISHSRYNKDKLVQIQRISLVSIVKAHKTVADIALTVTAGIPPLDVKLDELKKVYDLCKNKESYTTSEETINYQDIYQEENQLTAPWKREQLKFEKWLGDPGPNFEDINLFTDGSKMGNRVGSGLVVTHNKKY